MIIILQISFQLLGKSWIFTPGDSSLVEDNSEAVRDGVVSPNGEKIAFVRDYNIWILDKSSGRERSITQDGSSKYFYGTITDTPGVAVWSWDSQWHEGLQRVSCFVV